jgi:hypothetical protein
MISAFQMHNYGFLQTIYKIQRSTFRLSLPQELRLVFGPGSTFP